jgi:hypothetical protein
MGWAPPRETSPGSLPPLVPDFGGWFTDTTVNMGVNLSRMLCFVHHTLNVTAKNCASATAASPRPSPRVFAARWCGAQYFTHCQRDFVQFGGVQAQPTCSLMVPVPW